MCLGGTGIQAKPSDIHILFILDDGDAVILKTVAEVGLAEKEFGLKKFGAHDRQAITEIRTIPLHRPQKIEHNIISLKAIV